MLPASALVRISVDKQKIETNVCPPYSFNSFDAGFKDPS